MGTKVVLEVAALADALTKAAAVAPTRGVSFEKAAGIVLSVAADEVIVRSTDTVTKFATWLTPELVEGPETMWRVPSKVFSEVISKLKTTMNKTLTLEQDGATLKMTHGRSTRASFMMIDMDNYPLWSPFSPDDMKLAAGLAVAAEAVQWAASKGTDVPLTGVHFDGTHAMATNKYKFAVMDCPVDLAQPITVPAAALTTVLKNQNTTLVRVDSNSLYMMPDESTQISTSVYGVPFPSAAIGNFMKRTYPHTVRVGKKEIVDMLDLVCSMIQSDRQPTLILLFGRGEIAAMLSNTSTGLLGNIIETPGQLDFEKRHEIRFQPDIIQGALQGCTANEVEMSFDPSNSMLPFFINGGAIRYWLAPKQKMEAEVE